MNNDDSVAAQLSCSGLGCMSILAPLWPIGLAILLSQVRIPRRATLLMVEAYVGKSLNAIVQQLHVGVPYSGWF